MSLSVEDLARLHADLAPALERLIVSITAGDVHTTNACRNDCLQSELSAQSETPCMQPLIAQLYSQELEI